MNSILHFAYCILQNVMLEFAYNFKNKFIRGNNMQNCKWPYPIEWKKEENIDADVLVLGGGVAGCMAAISASDVSR